MITYDVDLCIGIDAQDNLVTIKNHDTGASIRTRLFICQHGKWLDKLEPYNIPAGSTAVLRIVKPDKKYCLTDGTVESNSVLFELPPQAFTTAGICRAEVSLYGGDGKRITTGSFGISVPEECICGCDLESENYIDVMSEQILAAIDAAERAEAAVVHGPIIKDGTWWLWDLEAEEYKDSGVRATGSGEGGGGIAFESDPTVPAWAKQPEKPKYTAQEVGALSSNTVIPTKPEDVNASPKLMVVDIVNGVASHTPAQIYAHVQAGGEAITYGMVGAVHRIDTISETSAVFVCNNIDSTAVSKDYVVIAVNGKVTIGQNHYNPTVPTTLPNPNALTFTGAVEGSYDGSKPVSIEIPQGGGGGGNEDAAPKQIVVEVEKFPASHTPAQIYAHVQAGGDAITYGKDGAVHRIDTIDETSVTFVRDSITADSIKSNKITVTNGGISTQPRTYKPILSNALTFTGAVEGTFDGSQALTIEIPQGGGESGGGESKEWVHIAQIEIAEDIDKIFITEDVNGKPFEVENIYAFIKTVQRTEDTSTFRLMKALYNSGKVNENHSQNYGALIQQNSFGNKSNVKYNYYESVVVGNYRKLKMVESNGAFSNIINAVAPNVNPDGVTVAAIRERPEYSYHNATVDAVFMWATNGFKVGDTIDIWGI